MSAEPSDAETVAKIVENHAGKLAAMVRSGRGKIWPDRRNEARYHLRTVIQQAENLAKLLEADD